MIKSDQTALIIQQGDTHTTPVHIYSRIMSTTTDWEKEIFTISYVDFYLSEGNEMPMRDDTFNISFAEYDGLLEQMGSIDSKKKEYIITQQAHAYINNRDSVYGVQWAVVTEEE